MKRILFKRPLRWNVAGLLLVGSIWMAAPSAHANVYATNIKLNGSVTNVTANPGESVLISYLLNEQASGGIVVDILRDSTLIRKISLPANGPGTSRGANSVAWDLRDASSNIVSPGTYSVRITAGAAGYSTWTQISSDTDPNSYVYWGRGISVDQDSTSPYFGRVLIANSAIGFSPDVFPGDNLGILRFNADGSAPETGIVGVDGVSWSGSGIGPEKVEASGGRVYANDLGLNGRVFGWDKEISTNSLLQVLRQDNRPAGAAVGGLAVSMQGTNTYLWMADRASNHGVIKWALGPDGACATGDTGTNVVGLGSDPTGLSLPPQDVALDRNGNIYVCQAVGDAANPLQRVFRYRAYDPVTNGGLPALVAEWAAGGGDDTFCGASGIAVDPTSTYVAASFEGVTLFGGDLQGGNTKILYATNGAVAVSLDALPGNPFRQHTDCAWDAAGNVYYIENYLGVWRIVSPPGTNHMVTVAPAAVVVGGTVTTPPAITGISVSAGVVTITFTASPADLPESFAVLGSTSLAGPFTVVPNANITSSGGGVFRAVMPSSGTAQFYRVEHRTSPPPQQPEFKKITVSGGNVAITFTGAANDSASVFTLLSAGSPGGTYSTVQNAQFSGSAGTFQVTAPTNGLMRFYRIQR